MIRATSPARACAGRATSSAALQVKVLSRERQDNSAGLKAMEDIIRARLKAAEVAEETTFDSSETLDYFCRMSGGHTRNLLILLRSACDYLDALPVARMVLEEAVQGMRTDFERALNRSSFFDTFLGPAEQRPRTAASCCARTAADLAARLRP